MIQTRSWLAAVLLVCPIAAAPCQARPDAFWANPVNGDWTVAANWLGGVVPNNSTWDVFLNAVGSNYQVTWNTTNTTLNSITLGSANARLSLRTGTARAVNGVSLVPGSVLNISNPNSLGGTTLTQTTVSGGGLLQLAWGAALDTVIVDSDAQIRAGDGVQVRNNLRITPGRTLSILAPASGRTDLYLTGSAAQSIFGGTISFDGEANNQIQIWAPQNGLTIEPGTLVRSTTAGAQIGSVDRTIINRGIISADASGRTVRIDSLNFVNQGLLRTASGGVLELHGSVAVGGIGNLSSPAGRISLAGVLNNIGNTVLLDAPEERLSLSATFGNGEVVGGTLATSNGGQFFMGPGIPRLTGVTLDTDFTVNAGRTLFINNSLAIAAGRSLRIGETGQSATAAVQFLTSGANSVSGPGEVVFNGLVSGGTSFPTNTILPTNAGSTLVFEPNLTVRSGTDGAIIGTNSLGFVNRGTIISSVPGRPIIVRGSNWKNEGVIQLDGGGLQIEGTLAPGGLGTVTGTGVSSIYLDSSGTFDNTGAEIQLGGDSPVRVRLAGQFKGGTVLMNDNEPPGRGGERIGTSPTSDKTAFRTDTKQNPEIVQVACIGFSTSGLAARSGGNRDERSVLDVFIDDRAFMALTTFTTVRVRDGLTLGDTTIVLDDASNRGLRFIGTQTLAAAEGRLIGGGTTGVARGTVLFQGNGVPQYFSNDSGTLTIGQGIAMVTGTGSATLNIAAGATGIVNNGLISAREPSRYIEVVSSASGGPFVNGPTGIIEAANGGTFRFGTTGTPISWSSTGTIRAGVGGVVSVMSGGYTMTPQGTTWIEFGGRSAGQFGRFTVTGATVLNGTLKCEIAPGFVPTWGDVWTVLTSTTTASGAFTSVIGDALPDPAWRWWSDISGSTVRVGVSHAADLNRDNAINTADLVAFLGQFGQAGSNLAADLNSDGAVNTADLVQFLGAFGLSAAGRSA